MSREPRHTAHTLPVALPLSFAERLGYRSDQRFVAAYWEPLGDEVTVCDDHWTATGLADRYAWSDFVHQRELQTWLSQKGLNLGNSDQGATHWLIIDRLTDDGFVADALHGRRIVQQQRRSSVE